MSRPISDGKAAALDPMALLAACQRKGRTTLEKFWARFDKNGPIPIHKPELGPCWVWKGYITRDGYGSVSWGGRDVGIHRLSCALTHGPLAAGVLAIHACDFRPCGRPDHLTPGTSLDNNRDMIAKGRNVVSDGDATRGVLNVNAKLTDDKVRELRVAWMQGESIKSISRRTGLAVGTVHPALKGRTWRHVESAEVLVAALRRSA